MRNINKYIYNVKHCIFAFINQKQLQFYASLIILLIISLSSAIILNFYIFRYTDVLTWVFWFTISLLLSSYIINNFSYSNIVIIRLAQKLLIYSLIFIILGYIIYLASSDVYCSSPSDNNNFQSTSTIETDINTKNVVSTLDNKSKSQIVEVSTDNQHYHFKLDKNMVNQTANIVKDVLTDYGSGLAKNASSGTAAGTAAAAYLKYSKGMPGIQRAIGLGGVSAITAASTKIGVEAANIMLNQNFKSNTSNNPEIPSPKDDQFNINSALESSEVINPLIELLRMSLTLNVFTLILVLILLILIFNRFIIRTNLETISKYLPNSFLKAQGWLNKTSDRFLLFMFIFISIILLFILSLNIIISSHIFINIGDYANDYVNSNLPLP
uniref:Uncharacterized protein n=1 Tax=Cantharellus cibarius TaxID=36066 RepID=A0A2S0S485_CANCI|nr:hypothetical protein [Cantharellus cibarius]